MTHWTLDQFNMMKKGDVTEAERADLVDHLLACDACATRFRMMNDLDQSLAKKQKHPIRYAIGAAAVLFMAAYPYFTTPEQPAPPLPENQILMADSGSLGVLDQVRQVNWQNTVDRWGSETSLNDLVQLQNED